VFAAVLGAYLLTLAGNFPETRVIERSAETIPGYDANYPPFRMDEHVYDAIARSVLAGDLYRDGAPEFSYPVGFPLVAAPFVAVFGQAGGYVANLIILWLSAVVFFLVVRRFAGFGRALIATAVLAFATLNWFYANSCYTEPLSQLLVIASFACLTASVQDRGNQDACIAGAGVLLGLNLFVRPHYILLAAPFFGYLAFERRTVRLNRDALIFLAGVSMLMLAWFGRNWTVFGSPLAFEYSRIANQFNFAGNASNVEGNILLGIHRVLFDIYHGLLTITPIFLLFPAGLRSMWLSGFRRESLILLASAAVMILFVSAGPYPFTEFGLGSRHLVPLIPLLLLPAAVYIDFSLFRNALFVLLAAYSFYHAGIGWFTGTEPGRGIALGILNDNQARGIILSRKGLLPNGEFSSDRELVDAFRRSVERVDMYGMLRTLDPETRELIRGRERLVLDELCRQEDPTKIIGAADPSRGLRLDIMFQ
jgi:hypothetical protein